MPPPTDRNAGFERATVRAARELASEAKALVTNHPEPEELIAYQEGRLAVDEAEELRRHLVVCGPCAQDVLELEEFDLDRPTEANLLPSPEETAEDWAAFSRHAREQLPTTTLSAKPAESKSARKQGEQWLIAASFLVALTGLGFWIAGLGQAIQSRGSISPHPFVFDLLPDSEEMRRAASKAREIMVPPGMNPLLPRLNLGDQTPYDGYRADILNTSARTVWSQPELKRQPGGEFVLLCRREELADGLYQLRLLGIADGEETVIATYSFVLRSPTDE